MGIMKLALASAAAMVGLAGTGFGAVAPAAPAAQQSVVMEASITGEVRARVDRHVVAVVDLWNQDTGELADTVFTDHDGNFEFVDVRPGTYKVVATSEDSEQGSEEVIVGRRDWDIHIVIWVSPL